MLLEVQSFEYKNGSNSHFNNNNFNRVLINIKQCAKAFWTIDVK